MSRLLEVFFPPPFFLWSLWLYVYANYTRINFPSKFYLCFCSEPQWAPQCEIGSEFCALSLLAAATFFPHLEPQAIFCISGCVLTTELVSLLFPPEPGDSNRGRLANRNSLLTASGISGVA